MAMSLWTTIRGLLIQDETDRTKELSLEIDSAATTGTRTTLKAAQTANRTITLPDNNAVLVGEATTQTLTNKTIDADLNTITNIENADIKAAAAIDASKIADGTVSSTEFQYINSLTSNAQTQLTNNATAISDHLADTVDAHDASAISNIPSGNLSATDVQAALNELQTEVDGIALASGTVTNIATGTGLTGGPITTTGTINLANTAVTPGSYTYSSFTVDAQGRITIASNGTTPANTTLSNLGSTAVNADILPATTGTITAGSLTKRFSQVSADVYNAVGTSGSGAYRLVDAAGNSYGQFVGNITTPSGVAATTAVVNAASNTGGLAIYTVTNNTADANPTKDLLIETGNKTAGTGNSGNIKLKVGTSSGGVRGNVSLDGLEVDVNSTKIVNVTDPASAQDAATKNYVDNKAIKVAFVKDVQSSGTDGGSFTSGSYVTRTLNTLEGDNSFISIGSNQITLDAGTYFIEASATSYLVNRNRIRLQNITDTSTTVLGQNCNSNSTTGDQEVALLSGYFTIAGTKVFELQHRCSTTNAGANGRGLANSFGDSELYTQIKIVQIN